MMSTRTTMMGVMAMAAALFAGCHGRDEPVFTGDPAGIPMTIAVTYHDDVFAAPTLRDYFTRVLVHQRRTIRDSVYYGPGFSATTYHYEWVEYQPRIRFLLLGGDYAGDESLWYWPLHPGTQTTTVTIRPGHQVVLTVRAEGGYRGETVIATIAPLAVAGPQQVSVALDHEGAHVSPIGVPGTPPPPAAPPPTSAQP